MFDQGLEAYKKGQYPKSRIHLQQLLELPRNQRSSAALLVLGKTLFRLNEYESALHMVKQLQGEFTSSRYLSHGLLLSGDCYYVIRRYYEATTQYGRVLAMDAPLELQARAAERLAAIVKNGLISAKALDNIRLGVGAVRLWEALLFGEARWYQRLGWKEHGHAALQVYVDSVPDGIFAALSSQGLESSPEMHVVESPAEVVDGLVVEEPAGRQDGAERPRLGLLLPLSGTRWRLGRDLLAGVQLANEELGRVFELAVEDTGFEYADLPIAESVGSEPLRSFLAARRLIEQQQVVSIIGPVFSNATIAAAAVAEIAGVPLIAPLAQQSGLDSLGRHIFQLNVTPEAQGGALGEYAILVLGLHELVVIAPLSDYGWSFKREFTRAVQSYGGSVVYADWYVPNETKDFKRIFKEVRRVGFDLMRASARYDQELWQEGEEEMAEEEELTYSPELFIDSIDGVVIVVEHFEDAKVIAPQLHFHRLQTQILGNDIWHESAAIQQLRPTERRYIEGAIFVSSYNDAAVVYRKFVDDYRRRFRRDPGYAAYGYDAARLVLEGWKKGHQTRGDLSDWIAATQGFEGASGTISFEPGRRTNSEFFLMRIEPTGRLQLLSSEE